MKPVLISVALAILSWVSFIILIFFTEKFKETSLHEVLFYIFLFGPYLSLGLSTWARFDKRSEKPVKRLAICSIFTVSLLVLCHIVQFVTNFLVRFQRTQ